MALLGGRRQRDPDAPPPQTPWAMWVVIAGIAAVTVVTALAVFEYEKASDVVTVVTPVTGIIAGMVGTYFGLRGTTLAQDKLMQWAELEREGLGRRRSDGKRGGPDQPGRGGGQ